MDPHSPRELEGVLDTGLDFEGTDGVKDYSFGLPEAAESHLAPVSSTVKEREQSFVRIGGAQPLGFRAAFLVSLGWIEGLQALEGNESGEGGFHHLRGDEGELRIFSNRLHDRAQDRHPQRRSRRSLPRPPDNKNEENER